MYYIKKGENNRADIYGYEAEGTFSVTCIPEKPHDRISYVTELFVSENNSLYWDWVRLEDIKSHEQLIQEKNLELNSAMSQVVYAGKYIETSKGIQHFTFDLFDQQKIKALFDSAYIEPKGSEKMFAWHSTDNMCRLYTANDMIAIGYTMIQYITYHETYLNSIHQYVKTLTADKLEHVVYGMDLPKEYMEHILFITSEGKEGKELII